MKKLLIFIACLTLIGCNLPDSGSQAQGYSISVSDKSGVPVQDVRIQFCTDDTCYTDITDENGIAVFDKEPGEYTVHVVSVPEGYSPDRNEYYTDEKSHILKITLE